MPVPVTNPPIMCQQMKPNGMQCNNPGYEYFHPTGASDAENVAYCRLHYSFLRSQQDDADRVAAEMQAIDDKKQSDKNLNPNIDTAI